MSSINPDSSQVDTSSNLPDECSAFRTIKKHSENAQKFAFCPLHYKTTCFPGKTRVLQAETTGFELLGVFPMFLDSSKGCSREIADRKANRLPSRWRMTEDP
jgi:hypothetical protein